MFATSVVHSDSSQLRRSLLLEGHFHSWLSNCRTQHHQPLETVSLTYTNLNRESDVSNTPFKTSQRQHNHVFTTTTTTSQRQEAARSVFPPLSPPRPPNSPSMIDLQATYGNYKNTLQQIAQKIGDIEQEAEEHKYVTSVPKPCSRHSNNTPLSPSTILDVTRPLLSSCHYLDHLTAPNIIPPLKSLTLPY